MEDWNGFCPMAAFNKIQRDEGQAYFNTSPVHWSQRNVVHSDFQMKIPSGIPGKRDKTQNLSHMPYYGQTTLDVFDKDR